MSASNGPWIYTGVSAVGGRTLVDAILQHPECMYCRAALVDLGSAVRNVAYVVPVSDAQRELARRAGQPIPDARAEHVERGEEEVEVLRCPVCGWWIARSPYLNAGGHVMYEFGYGQLRALDPADIGEPVEAIRAFLAAQYERRLDVHPRKFEEVVGSVFADLGYRARVTSYSGDGGVDVFLDGPEDVLIGVQVKRSRNAIKVEQINALTGALLINDCTAGVFVTTSQYQRGAVLAAKKASARGFPIELYDAARLYDVLKISQRAHSVGVNDTDAPWMTCAFPDHYKWR